MPKPVVPSDMAPNMLPPTNGVLVIGAVIVGIGIGAAIIGCCITGTGCGTWTSRTECTFADPCKRQRRAMLLRSITPSQRTAWYFKMPHSCQCESFTMTDSPSIASQLYIE